MKPLLLCILDGIGLTDEIKGNAFKMANTPFIDSLFKKYPNSKLKASGTYVGLPNGIMGNSEVGHMNIGAGKVVYQPSQFINEEIKNGNFYNNENLNEALEIVKEKDSSLHIIGLVSDAGVHSLLGHLYAILKKVKDSGINKVYIHGISDGRDTNPNSGINYFEELENHLKELGVGTIATICGRYYAMDRDNRWDRIKIAYDLMANGIGEYKSDVKTAIKESYENGITDEFIKPIILNKDGLIKENDVVIDFNFRPDRLRELLSALSNPNFNSFETKFVIKDLYTLMPVSNEVICKNFFTNQKVDMPLGVYLSKLGKTQLRIAETEKYAHVTYFFDGGKELDLEGCKRILIPSPKVATYDLSPNMSAGEITDALLKELDNNDLDVIILNFANGDMVGHTGDIEATIKSLEFLDGCVEKIYNKINEKEGLMIVTADHGNCEYMLDKEGNTVTSHSTNEVPFIVCKNGIKLKNGKLSDIAPTILKLMNLTIPEEMTGNVLIEED